MKQNKLRTLYEKDMTKKILASLLSILIGLVVGSVIIAAVGFSNPELGASSVWDGIRIVFAGLFSTGRTAAGVLTWGFNSTNFGNMLFRATPLIMTGLSVAVAFKTGLFNIGAPGQYLMGTLVSLCIALGIPSSSVAPWLIWILAFLGGVAAGALWGAIPGALKAFLNINEVLASIMTNWLAANLVTWMFDISNFKNLVENTKSGYIYKTTYNRVATAKLGLDKLLPELPGQCRHPRGHPLRRSVMYILMNKTTLGYELEGLRLPTATRPATPASADKRNIVLSMAIAGATRRRRRCAVLPVRQHGVFLEHVPDAPGRWASTASPSRCSRSTIPSRVIFTAIFMSVLDIAGLQLTNLTAYNEYITDVIIAAIVYLSAFSLVIRMLLDGRKKKRKSGGAPADDAPVEPAQSLGDPELHPDPAITDPGADAPIAEGGEQA